MNWGTRVAEDIDYEARREIFRQALADHGITRCVLVTGSFRAGTSFVCSLLARNGMPSIGNEKFSGFYSYREPGNETQLRAALDGVFATAQDGLFCAKIMWPHRNNLALTLGYQREDSAEFAQIFPQAKWINILRRDKIDQAISFWKAKQTDRWHVFKDEAEPEVEYDFAGLRGALSELSIHDRLWRVFYRHAGVTPSDVVYEEFQRRPAVHLKTLLEEIGPDHRLQTGEVVAVSGLRRQRNANSDRLRQQFLDDCFRSGS